MTTKKATTKSRWIMRKDGSWRDRDWPRHWPDMPPYLDDKETQDQYTDRLTGADKANRVPYKERRNRQCSIGYHDECSDPAGETCECPCHKSSRGCRS